MTSDAAVKAMVVGSGPGSQEHKIVRKKEKQSPFLLLCSMAIAPAAAAANVSLADDIRDKSGSSRTCRLNLGTWSDISLN